jgi:hypothetical protein
MSPGFRGGFGGGFRGGPGGFRGGPVAIGRGARIPGGFRYPGIRGYRPAAIYRGAPGFYGRRFPGYRPIYGNVRPIYRGAYGWRGPYGRRYPYYRSYRRYPSYGYYGGALAAGLALGALTYPYYYGAGYGYGYGYPYYEATYEPVCFWTRRRVVVRGGRAIVRRVYVCEY